MLLDEMMVLPLPTAQPSLLVSAVVASRLADVGTVLLALFVGSFETFDQALDAVWQAFPEQNSTVPAFPTAHTAFAAPPLTPLSGGRADVPGVTSVHVAEFVPQLPLQPKTFPAPATLPTATAWFWSKPTTLVKFAVLARVVFAQPDALVAHVPTLHVSTVPPEPTAMT
jgi:hypothetical protein